MLGVSCGGSNEVSKLGIGFSVTDALDTSVPTVVTGLTAVPIPSEIFAFTLVVASGTGIV